MPREQSSVSDVVPIRPDDPRWRLTGSEAMEAADALWTPARRTMPGLDAYLDAASEYAHKAVWALVAGDLWGALRAAKIAVHIELHRRQHEASRARVAETTGEPVSCLPADPDRLAPAVRAAARRPSARR